MQMRRPEGAAAAVLLTALLATLPLMATTGGAAQAGAANSATTRTVAASAASTAPAAGMTENQAGTVPRLHTEIRYGCEDGGFVEVSLQRMKSDESGDSSTDASNATGDGDAVYQVGLSGPDSADAGGMFPEGGPTLVVLGSGKATVRLAGPVNRGDHVFIRQVGQMPVLALPLEPTCQLRRPLNFGLRQASVQVTATRCASTTQAKLVATVDNPNSNDEVYRRLSGMNSVDFTVLLVRSADGRMTSPTKDQLLQFGGRGLKDVRLTAAAAEPVTYEVRAIGVDGQTATPQTVTVDCSALGSSRPPGPTFTPSRPPTSSATTSSPGPSTSQPGTPSGQSSTTQAAPAESSAGAQVSVGSTEPSVPTGPTTPARSPGTGGRSNPPSTASGTPATSSTLPDLANLAGPRSGGHIFLWQRDAALVVAIDALAIGALVGITVWRARRR